MNGDLAAAQRARSLAQANHTRDYRHRLHDRMNRDHNHLASRRILANVLDGGVPTELRSLHVVMLLGWVFYLPRPTAERLVAALDASPVITAGQLSNRQRRLLVMMLRGDLLPPPTRSGDD